MQNMVFRMMPSVDGMLSYEDKLLMYDNIDKTIQESLTEEITSLITGMPKKVYFTIVLLCVDGSVKARCNLKNYSVHNGGLLIIVPNTIVESFSFSPNSTLIAFAFSDDSYAPSMAFFDSAYARTRFVSPVHLELSQDIMSECVETFRRLKYTLEHFGEKVNEDLIKAYMQVLSGLVAIGIKEHEKNNPVIHLSSKEKIVKDFLTRVASDFYQYRDVTHYADAACLSPKYFAKLIYHTSGKHPAQWIQDYVILEAKTMLHSGYSIQQVCDALNFKTQSHFGRYFKIATGITPKQYVRQ